MAKPTKEEVLAAKDEFVAAKKAHGHESPEAETARIKLTDLICKTRCS